MFLSSQKDPDTSSEERNLSATSPSSKDEGLKMDRPKDDSSDGLVDAEPLVQSVIGPDGLKEFIMQPIWTVNNFTSTIKESHFKTLKENQIPVNISMHLPYMSKKCYYEGVEVYEQMLKVGLKFPLSSLHCRLL